MVTAPQTHTQTNRQDRLQYTSSLSLARSVISLLLLLILLRIYHPSVLLHDVLAHTCGNIKLWPRVGGDLTWAYITLIGVKLKLNIILFPGFYVARWPQWLGVDLRSAGHGPVQKRPPRCQLLQPWTSCLHTCLRHQAVLIGNCRTLGMYSTAVSDLAAPLVRSCGGLQEFYRYGTGEFDKFC